MKDSAQTILLVYAGGLDLQDFITASRGKAAVYYKLGLHALAAVLEKDGRRCRVIDGQLDPISPAGLRREVARERPAAVGFYTSARIGDVEGALAGLRQEFPDLPLICGGPGAFEPARWLDAGATAVVHGEGEETLPDLLDALERGRPLAEIRGISYRGADGAVMATGRRPPIADLDALPFARIQPEMAARYTGHVSFRGASRVLRLMASRGCPFRCAYCSSHAVFGRGVRTRSVENVLAEIDDARERLGIDHVAFQDDVFAWDPGWRDRFAEGMRRRDVTFDVNIHPLSFRDDPEGALRRLGAAGLTTVQIGLQTIDPRTQRLMHRSADEPGAVVRLCTAARAARVTPAVHFIVGLPWDTIETFDEIRRYLLRARPVNFYLWALRLLPGSELWDTPPPPSALDDEAIAREGRVLARRYYLHPAIVLANAWFIGRVSPRGLLTVVPREAMGFLGAPRWIPAMWRRRSPL